MQINGFVIYSYTWSVLMYRRHFAAKTHTAQHNAAIIEWTYEFIFQ